MEALAFIRVLMGAAERNDPNHSTYNLIWIMPA